MATKMSASTAHTSMMTRAIQPIVADKLTLRNDLPASEPAMFKYTSANTGRMTTTVKPKMTLMMTRSAAG